MNVELLLDQLADFQDQRDYLALKRNELIDAVKIPDEIQAIHDEANRRKNELDALYQAVANNLQEQEAEALASVVVPEEVKEVFRQIEARRQDIQRQTAEKKRKEWEAAAAQKAKIDAEFTASVADVYAGINARKAEITAEFGEKLSAVDSNIAKLTDDIKNAVIAQKESIKGKRYHAVYMKGRVSWNTDKLDGMMIVIPALAEARKEGEPSVSIRKV